MAKQTDDHRKQDIAILAFAQQYFRKFGTKPSFKAISQGTGIPQKCVESSMTRIEKAGYFE